MASTKLIFYKAEYGDWTDKLIAWWTKSPYSHVEIVLKENSCFSASPREDLVRIKNIDIESGHWDAVETNLKIDLTRIGNILNKKYDWLGIFLSETIPLDIHDRGKWYCSEGCSYVLRLDETRVSPGELYETALKHKIDV